MKRYFALIGILTLTLVACSAPKDVSGKWKVEGETPWRVLELSQTGKHVNGSYQPFRGKVEGKLSGRTLKGTWYDRNQGGDLHITFRDDTFVAKWKGSGEDDWRNEVTGTRVE